MKQFLFVGVTSVDHSPIPLDGYNVWDTISLGKPSPRTEILINIDQPGEVPPGPGILGGFTGIALRVGEMKLLMNVPNVTWFKPPEMGGKPEDLPLDTAMKLPDVVRHVYMWLAKFLQKEDVNNQDTVMREKSEIEQGSELIFSLLLSVHSTTYSQ